MSTPLAVVACLAAAAQTPVFEAQVDSVYVDAMVTRDGRPVLGLGASDFVLTDEGRPVTAELVGASSLPLVAVLAFDASRSVAGRKLTALQVAGAAFLEGLQPADQASLVTFNEEVTWVVAPTEDKAQVARALSAIQPRGGTALFDGVYAATALPASPARILAVVFSDGQDTVSWLDEAQVAGALARSNALVHVVGLVTPRKAFQRSVLDDEHADGYESQGRHVQVLGRLAGATGGRFWSASTADGLRTVFADIATSMRHRYVLRFDPPPGAAPGWRRLQVKLRRGKGTVQARPGYWARGAERTE